MPSRHSLLAVILGGGAGSRLFPLTAQRSKPAVPLGGKYRLVDVPISNCINSDVIRMFVTGSGGVPPAVSRKLV